MSLGIDSGKHIDVTATAIGKISIRIGTADENREWFGGDIDVGMGSSLLGLDFDFDGVDNTCALFKATIFFGNDIFVDGAEQNCINFVVREGGWQSIDGIKVLQLNLGAGL